VIFSNANQPILLVSEMAQIAKIKSVPGPHHCLAAGKHARDWVFDAMLQEADKNNGSINRIQIVALRQAFENSNGALFEAATDVHNFCMASHNKKNMGNFDKTVIFKFLIGEYISDLLPKIFPQQNKYAHGKWKLICSGFAADMIQNRVRANVCVEYFDLYVKIAAIKGRNFTLSDLTKNRDVHILTRSIIEEAKKAFKSQDNISKDISGEMNAYILHKPGFIQAHLLLIKVRQMTEFLLALSRSKTGNDFRAKVQEVTRN
jgi:hypothetical protein